MNFYERYILPRLIHFACKQNLAKGQREKIVPLAEGNILEIGIGSGLNLAYYDPEKVQHLIGIDPSRELWELNTEKASVPFEVHFLNALAEDIPVDSKSIDTILITYTLCSISDLPAAFEEMRRVLKPSGKLVFCEHGKSPDSSVYRAQKFINPAWKRFGGGCHLTRDIPNLISNSGFNIQQLEQGYLPGWKVATYNYWGVAKMR